MSDVRNASLNRRRLLGATVGAGAAAVLATNEGLRNQVFGSAKALGEEIVGGDESPGGENGSPS